jgi:hypothetical protein
MNYLALLLESEAKNILLPNVPNKGAKAAKGQENAKSGPALLALQDAARRHQCDGVPGLVVVSDELLKLWHAAETEAGHALTPGGAVRRLPPPPPDFLPRLAFTDEAAALGAVNGEGDQ